MAISLSQDLYAMALDWNGLYRIEYLDIDRTEMTSGSRKGYLLNNLILMPHIIPSDGIEVVSKIHLMENDDPRYENFQAGAIWGNTVNPGTSTYIDNSNALSQNRAKTRLAVSQMYLKMTQEWGSLVVGRAPMHFGLGITHNAGNDPFDHWFDTRDLIAYKVHIGHVFIMPFISKQYANDFEAGNEITNQSLHIEYRNHDTGNWLGVFYETSKGSHLANDVPLAPLNGTAITRSLDLTSYNVFLGKDFTDFNFRLEGGFQSGSTGATDAQGASIALSGYAVVGEFNYNPSDSRNQWQLKVGTISGDNPETPDFEGYLVDRNYNVGLLLFNHRLGDGADIFKTSLGRDPAYTSPRNSIDDEFISNVLFAAPQWKRQLADRWTMRNTLILARLSNNRMAIGAGFEDIASDVGYEWDLSFSYKATENIEWKFESGLLIPGKAFEMGSSNSRTSTVFGLNTAAAITF